MVTYVDQGRPAWFCLIANRMAHNQLTGRCCNYRGPVLPLASFPLAALLDMAALRVFGFTAERIQT